MTNFSAQLIQSLRPARILVIGDLILDRYIQGEVDRISPEGPIPVLLAKEHHECPGGAANVAGNLAKMGARVSLAGILGQDPAGRQLKKLIKQWGVDTQPIFIDKRPTCVKTRFLCQGQQLLRLDEEKTHFLHSAQWNLWWKILKKEMRQADLIVFSDYAKGVFHQDLLTKIFQENKKFKKNILVDPKGQDYSKYRGATLITPNLKECALASGYDIQNEEDLLKASRKLLKMTHCRQILVTQGAEGMSLINAKTHLHQPTQAQSVYDVSGAGDSVIAAFALGWANQLTPEQCMHLANLAGGIAVSRLGAHPVSLKDLLGALSDEEFDKIVTLEELANLRKQYRQKEKTVVLTTGCFDLIHSGHLSLLKEAKDQGDILVVGINSDQSVRHLKGAERPVADEQQRAHLLAGFSTVDHVVIFSENSPRKLIGKLAPDVWVKGGDYKNFAQDSVFAQELATVKKNKGKLHLARFIDGHSTTQLINKIRSQ